MKSNSLGFIGGGRITRIFLQALKNRNFKCESILVFDTNKEILGKLKTDFPEITQAESATEAARQSTVFLALHPPIIMEMLDLVKNVITNETSVISFAPKITIEKIAAKLTTGNIMRMIPNAASFINEGFNPVTFGANFNKEGKSVVMELIRTLGDTFEVAEEKLEAYAILSAMLPTYFWFQWNELTKIGTGMGLTENESRSSILKTIDAASHLMFQSGLTPEQVMDLIPVKPIGEYEDQIKEIYQSKLKGLYEKIKP